MRKEQRPPSIRHATSEPYHFFGRTAELGLLDRALCETDPSVVALIGPGGQGKTAIVQHWLERVMGRESAADGLFLWSFYRGKDADLCLRELYAYAEGLDQAPDVSASYCVDQLLPLLCRERWVLILDGTEVVQYEAGAWFGRFVHPELGRLIEEAASAPLPGVVVLTSRFPVPGLELRKHARVLSLAGLDSTSAASLLRSLGVMGSETELCEAAAACGFHAKAVELLGTYLVRFEEGEAWRHRALASPAPGPGMSDEEQKVARILAVYQAALSPESRDILALATAFRDPPSEASLLAYLASPPVRTLFHETWGRSYTPFADRPVPWLGEQVQELIGMRLLERVGGAPNPASARSNSPPAPVVIDAHPLVRRAFERALGPGGRSQSARSRAGFLHGRPDRRRPATLEEAREEVEMFHAYCDAGLWNEADGIYVALENPKHRFLAPAFERDLLLRFFPGGDWRRPPLWPGFGRYRGLAISLELLGCFKDALAVYREADAALRGDALLALGRLEPLLAESQSAHLWATLWQAYRTHALALAGRAEEALALTRSLVPVDVYEWTHVFECLLRCGELQALNTESFLYRPPHAGDQRWGDLARQRMRADYLRVLAPEEDLDRVYEELLDAYDRGGLPYERGLTRLGYVRWLLARDQLRRAQAVNLVTLELAQRHAMRILEADAWHMAGEIASRQKESSLSQRARTEEERLRNEVGYNGASRK